MNLLNLSESETNDIRLIVALFKGKTKEESFKIIEDVKYIHKIYLQMLGENRTDFNIYMYERILMLMQLEKLNEIND
jgi:hypothetical protein